MAIAPARSIFAETFVGLVRVQTQKQPFSLTRTFLTGRMTGREADRLCSFRNVLQRQRLIAEREGAQVSS
jgi:hypothetical protein